MSVKPRTDDVFFVFATLFLAYNIVHYLMYSQRLLGWLLTKMLMHALSGQGVRVKIGSIMISPLSGRIMFADVQYFDSSSHVQIVDGYVKFKWWAVLPLPEQRTPEKTKLTIHLNGLRLAMYNNIGKFEDFKEKYESRFDKDKDKDGQHMKFQGLHEDASTANPPMAMNSDKKPLTSNPPANLFQKIMKFLGHVAFDIREGTFALGAPTRKNPYYLQMAFKQFIGIHHLENEFLSKEDLYRVVVDMSMKDLSMQVMKFKYRMGDQQRAMGASGVGIRPDPRRSDTRKGEDVSESPAAGTRGLGHFAQQGKRMLMFAIYGDQGDGEGGQEAQDGATDDEVLQAMLDHPQTERLTQFFGTIVDPAKPCTMRMLYYQDSPGVELVGKNPSRNHDELPKMGLNIDIYASQIAYGPFINLIRSQVQTLFFPWDLRTWGQYEPKVGQWRAFGAYEQVITFKQDCIVNLPWRQCKKGVSVTPPMNLVYSGEDQMMSICLGEGSQYLFKYPYVQPTEEGVITEALFDLKNVTIRTSLEDGQLVRTGRASEQTPFLQAREMKVFLDCQYPSCYKFNELHHWDTIIHLTEGEVYYLAEHGAYFGDFFTDFGYPGVMYLGEKLQDTFSGSREFMVKEYAPYVQRFEVFLRHFDVKLCVNDGNVVEKHGSEENAMVTWRLKEMNVEYISPADAFTVTQETEFPSTLNLFVGHSELLLHLPQTHEVYEHFKEEDVQQCFGTIGEIRVSGNINVAHPDTHHAQGRPSWTPHRETPFSWYAGFIRTPDLDKTHAMGDLSSLSVTVHRPVFALQGWHLRYLGNLGENYGGGSSCFVSAAEYTRWADKTHPAGRNLRSTYFEYVTSRGGKDLPWKEAFSNVTVTITAVQVYLPLYPQSMTAFHGTPVLERDVPIRAFRTGPGTPPPPIATAKRGETLIVTGTVGSGASKCVCVRYKATTGYVDRDLISEEGARFWEDKWYYHPRVPQTDAVVEGSELEECGDFADLSCYEIRVETNNSGTASDVAVVVSPLSLRCPLSRCTDIRTRQHEYFIGVEGVALNTSSLSGPLPFCQTFCNVVKAQVGHVTVNVLMSQVVLLEHLAKNLAAHVAFGDTGLKAKLAAPLDRDDRHPKFCVFPSRGYVHEGNDARGSPPPTAFEGSVVSELGQFKSWLALKASKQEEAASKAYVVQKVCLDSLSAHLHLELGVGHVQIDRVSFADSTYDDRSCNKRGTLVAPMLSAKLLMRKTGQQLRDLGGDHLEVGYITCALRVRLTHAARATGTQDVGHDAQRKFLQKFDLSRYGLDATLGVEEGRVGGESVAGKKKWKVLSDAVGVTRLGRGRKGLAAAMGASLKKGDQQPQAGKAAEGSVPALEDSGRSTRTPESRPESRPDSPLRQDSPALESATESPSPRRVGFPDATDPGPRPQHTRRQTFAEGVDGERAPGFETTVPQRALTPPPLSEVMTPEGGGVFELSPPSSMGKPGSVYQNPLQLNFPREERDDMGEAGARYSPQEQVLKTPDTETQNPSLIPGIDGMYLPGTEGDVTSDACSTASLVIHPPDREESGGNAQADDPATPPTPYAPGTEGEAMSAMDDADAFYSDPCATEVRESATHGMRRTESGWFAPADRSQHSPLMSQATMTGAMDSCYSEMSEGEDGSLATIPRVNSNASDGVASRRRSFKNPRTIHSPGLYEASVTSPRAESSDNRRRRKSALPLWGYAAPPGSHDSDSDEVSLSGFRAFGETDGAEGAEGGREADLASPADAEGVLHSGKLHQGRGKPVNTALMYGRGHLRGECDYAYAPHPKVYFERASREGAGDASDAVPAGGDTASLRHLLEPAQAYSTIENQRENTSTKHTHVSFLQPLRALVSQHAATLLLHGSALHTLWTGDICSRYADVSVASSARPSEESAPKPPSKEENILSIQLAEAVVVCVIGLGETDAQATLARVPQTLRCVVNDVHVVQSERTAGAQRQTGGGRQPGSSKSLKVGSVGVALPHRGKPVCVTLPPHTSAKMRKALAPHDEPLLAYALLAGAGADPAAPGLHLRCRQEIAPSSQCVAHQIVANFASLFAGMGHEVELVRDALGEVTYLTSLYSVMQLDPVIHPDRAPAGEHELSDDGSESSESSFVHVNSGGVDGEVPLSEPSAKAKAKKRRRFSSRFDLREKLFGATQVVWDAMRRVRSSQSKTKAASTAPPPLSPLLAHSDKGDGWVEIEHFNAPADVLAAVSIDTPAPLGGSSTFEGGNAADPPTPLTPPPEEHPDLKARPDPLDPVQVLPPSTAPKPKPSPAAAADAEPLCLLGWIHEQSAVHLTVRVTEVRLTVDPAMAGTKPTDPLPFVALKAFDLRVQGGGERGRAPAPLRTGMSDLTDGAPPTHAVRVPITTVAQLGSFDGALEPAVVTVLQRMATCAGGSGQASRVPSCASPTTPVSPQTLPTPSCAEPRARVAYTLSLYASVALGGGTLQMFLSGGNYVQATVRHTTLLVTNREDRQTPPTTRAGMGGSDLDVKGLGRHKRERSMRQPRRGHAAENSDASKHSFDASATPPPAAKPRAKQESDGADVAQHVPSSHSFRRAGRDGGCGADAQAPSYILSLHVKNAKKASQGTTAAAPPPCAVLVQYFCRLELSKVPEEVFSFSAKAASGTMLYSDGKDPGATDTHNHAFVENLVFRVASHECFHTDHYLREWKTFVSCWVMTLSPTQTRTDPLSPSMNFDASLMSTRVPVPPLVSPPAPPGEAAKAKGAPPKVTVTFDLNRAEAVLPMTGDETFHYILRRLVGVMKAANGVTRASLTAQQSIVKVHDRRDGSQFPLREEFLPGVRVEYHEAVDASVAVSIDKLEMLLTPEIVNAWIHVSMTIAPVMRKWVDFSSPGEEKEPTPPPPSKIARVKVVSNGMNVGFVGGCAEFSITSSQGSLKWKLLKSAVASPVLGPHRSPMGRPSQSPGFPAVPDITVDVPTLSAAPGVQDLLLPRACTDSFAASATIRSVFEDDFKSRQDSSGVGPASPQAAAPAPPQPPQALWHIRFPRVGLGLHDCVAADRVAQWQAHRAKVVNTSFLSAVDAGASKGVPRRSSYLPGAQGHPSHDTSHMPTNDGLDGGYRWGSLSLGVYAGNEDLNDIIADDSLGISRPQGLPRAGSTLKMDPPERSAKEGDHEETVNILVLNPVTLVRAGMAETADELHTIYRRSFQAFKDTVGQEQRRFIGSEASNIKHATRRRIKRRLRDLRQADMETLAVAPGMWSLVVKNFNLTVPFGEKAYWCSKALAFNHTGSMLEQACLDPVEDSETPLSEVWATPGGRLLPSQALQCHLGSMQLVASITRDKSADKNAATGRAPLPASEQLRDTVKVLSLVKATDYRVYFSDGHALPKSWLRERDGQPIEHRWYREFGGSGFSYVLGGRGVLPPPSRELADGTTDGKTCLSVSETTLRLRGQISKYRQGMKAPINVTCDVSGPKAEIFPDTVCCLVDLTEDFTTAQMIGAHTRKADGLGMNFPRTPGMSYATSPDVGSNSNDAHFTPMNPSFGRPMTEGEGFGEDFGEATEAAAKPIALEVNYTVKVAKGELRFKSDEPVPDTFRDKKGDKSGTPAAQADTVFLLPTPVIELRGVASFPNDPTSDAVVQSNINAALTVAFPSEPIEIHPVALYFTNKLVMWQEDWPNRKVAWKDDIDTRLTGLREGLIEGLRATHIGGLRIAHAGLHLHTKMTKDGIFMLFINNHHFLDAIAPLPHGLINQAGCPPGCRLEHATNCLRCGHPFSEHRDHFCRHGGRHRGLFVDQASAAAWEVNTETPAVQVQMQAPSVTRCRQEMLSPVALTATSIEMLESAECVKVVTVTCALQDTTEQIRVTPAFMEKDLQQVCKTLLKIQGRWDVRAQEQNTLRPVRLTYDELKDGDTYLISAVGPQIMLSVRMYPLCVAATTSPVSDCRAVFETGNIDVTALSSPSTVTGGMLCVIGQPMGHTNTIIRASVKDRLHECMSLNVTSLTAVLIPSERQSVLVNVGYQGGLRGSEQALRLTCRLGNLRSFLVVSRVWQEKSEEAKEELLKVEHERAKVAAQSGRPEPAKTRQCSNHRPTGRTERKSKKLLVKEIAKVEDVEKNKFLLLRVESIAMDIDNFRVAHNNSSTDKFQLIIDDAVLINKETARVAWAPSLDPLAALPPRQDTMQFSEWSARTTTTTATSTPPPQMHSIQSGRWVFDARQTELVLKSVTLEAQGRVVSPSTSKTSDVLFVRARQLLRRPDCLRYEEGPPLPMTAVICEIPPLDLEMREIYKPLFKLRLRSKMVCKPAITLHIRDCYRPRAKASVSQPLNTYHVKVSVVVERVESEIRPEIFHRLQEVAQEMENTHQLQLLHADESLKTFTRKKARGRRERGETKPAVAEAASPVEEDAARDVVARGMFSLVLGDTLVLLGHGEEQNDCIRFGVKRLQLDVAQNLQRVGGDQLWGLLDSEHGENPESPPRRDTGRVDRVIKPLILTSWRIARQRGDVVETLLKADGDSYFKMHTDQYVGSPLVAYSFWSSFQNSWAVGKPDELVDLKRWLATFASAAKTDESSKQRVSQGMSEPPSQAPQPEERVFVRSRDGLTFKPVLQVVGDCTLAISAIFLQLGIEEQMVPSALHSVVTDNVVAVITGVYVALAPRIVIAQNKELCVDFLDAYQLIAEAHRVPRQEDADGADESTPPPALS